MTYKPLTKKQSELLKVIEGNEPKIIYQLAKTVGRPYRRVYDNIQMFAEQGLVALENVVLNNRASLKVIPMNPHCQTLRKLDGRYSSLLLPGQEAALSLSSTARKLSELFALHGAICGDVCGNLHGVDRDVEKAELATDLKPAHVINLLKQKGVEGTLSDSSSSWKIVGRYQDVAFTIVPADSISATLTDTLEVAGIRYISLQDYIRSLCMAGSQQDMQDVAAMALQNKTLMWFAMQQADHYGCREILDGFLSDS